MFMCLSKMFMCKFLISNMLPPKVVKVKEGNTSILTVFQVFRLSSADERKRLGGWNTEVTLYGQTMVHE
ncbi:hypothetical protein HanIR_Chr04g0161551 [Helianthus annuus]|nr:hypothetical protein HanIR_Chr04g0161551 [Helianthus annuus]